MLLIYFKIMLKIYIKFLLQDFWMILLIWKMKLILKFILIILEKKF